MIALGGASPPQLGIPVTRRTAVWTAQPVITPAYVPPAPPPPLQQQTILLPQTAPAITWTPPLFVASVVRTSSPPAEWTRPAFNDLFTLNPADVDLPITLMGDFVGGNAGQSQEEEAVTQHAGVVTSGSIPWGMIAALAVVLVLATQK